MDWDVLSKTLGGIAVVLYLLSLLCALKVTIKTRSWFVLEEAAKQITAVQVLEAANAACFFLEAATASAVIAVFSRLIMGA